MNLKTLVDSISEAVATDGDIIAWCLVTYGQTHKVYVNVNDADMPGESDCPYIVVYAEDKDAGTGRVETVHRVVVDCLVHDTELRSRSGIDNIIEYYGVSRCEELRKLIETAVSGVDYGNSELRDVNIDMDILTEYPFHFSGMTVEVVTYNYIGSDHLA